MGNNRNKMGECLHNIRKSAKLKMKAISKEQSELESRINECKKSLATINEFKKKNRIPQAVLQAILRGQDELEEEHYMLASEIFTRPKLCGPRLGVGSQVIVVVVGVVIIQTSRKSLGFQKPSSST